MGYSCCKYYTNNIHKTPSISHIKHICTIFPYLLFICLTTHFYDKYYFHFLVNIISIIL
nr:MAG TPA: ORMDL family protein [Caudoviricetes sp.]